MHYAAMDAYIPLVILEKMVSIWGKGIIQEFM